MTPPAVKDHQKIREEISKKLFELSIRCKDSNTPVWLDPYTDWFLAKLLSQKQEWVKVIEGMKGYKCHDSTHEAFNETNEEGYNKACEDIVCLLHKL